MNHYQKILCVLFCAAVCGCFAPSMPNAVEPQMKECARNLLVLERVSGGRSIDAMIPYLKYDILSPDQTRYVFMTVGRYACEVQAAVVVGNIASRVETILPIPGTSAVRWARWPIWCSDSRTLFCFTENGSNEAPEYVVYGVNTDTGDNRRLLTIREPAAKFYVLGESTLVFSVPDGRQWRRKAYDLYTEAFVDVDVSIPAHVVPAVSPDERYAAYCGNGYTVIVRDKSGGADRHITRVVGSALAWSPDGRYLLVVGHMSTRSPVARLRMYMAASDAIEQVLDGYIYDTETGKIIRMAVDESLLETFLVWRSQTSAPRPPAGR